MIKVIRETEDNIYCLCPFHPDTKESLCIHKTGFYAGQYRCWGCDAQGWAKDLGIQVDAKPTKKKKVVNWDALATQVNEEGTILPNLAKEWKVNFSNLRQLGYGWRKNYHYFLMRNEFYQIIGIQKRYFNGRKICMDRSKLGLFLPLIFPRCDSLLIAEGVSDTAVALNLGFAAIGRPSCNTGSRLIARWLQEHNPALFVSNGVLRHKWDKIVIVSDTGNQNEIDGAIKLRNYLTKHWRVDIIKPEAKDLRAYRDLIGHEKTKNWLLEMTK